MIKKLLNMFLKPEITIELREEIQFSKALNQIREKTGITPDRIEESFDLLNFDIEWESKIFKMIRMEFKECIIFIIVKKMLIKNIRSNK